MKITKRVIIKDMFTVTSSKIVFDRLIDRKIQRMSRDTSQKSGSHASPQNTKTILAHRIADSKVFPILYTIVLVMSGCYQQYSLKTSLRKLIVCCMNRGSEGL